SNVVFSAQTDNPGDVKFVPGRDPSLATDPLESTFGGWQAVENAALALAESANLLLIPGRHCANGLPVPMNNPDRSKFVQELLAGAGMCLAQPAGITPQMISRALPLEGAPLAEPGPYKITSEAAFGSPGLVVFRPTTLDAFPKKDTLPVMVWGNGGCAIDSTR